MAIRSAVLRSEAGAGWWQCSWIVCHHVGTQAAAIPV